MKHNPVDTQRRALLRLGAAATVAACSSMAAAQGAQRVDEKDPQAQGLGYKHDAAQVDKAKYAMFQAGQTCANCQQFQAKGNEEWAPCTIFGGKQVNAKGWCAVWAKKA